MREEKIYRKTKETEINVKINIDGVGEYNINTPVGFLNHMLETFSKHSLIDLEIYAKGDIEVDYHHIIEDIGICMGEALNKALGNKENIKRFGWSVVAMDEALVLSSVDISGRPFLNWDVKLKKEKLGNIDTELFKEFFNSFVNTAKITLHIKLLSGSNSHHIIEAIFKSVSKSIAQAIKIDKKIKGVPSTKDVL